ncbi:hypothetical protein H4582DRAFT_2077754 [Lactarius indigo]|nr:hypothetical protein H4582DRAFT_2077754 [Lactarius indigo]
MPSSPLVSLVQPYQISPSPAEDSTAIHEAMPDLVQGRLAGLLSKSENSTEESNGTINASFVALIGIQYLELTKPLYERCCALINAADGPTLEEYDAGQTYTINEWGNPVPLITGRDTEALKYLSDLRIEYFPSSEPKSGYKLIFNDEFGYWGDFLYDHVIGTEIKWKDEKDLTQESELKKQRNKTHSTESFFNVFSPPVAPSEEAIFKGDIDSEELDELFEKLDIDCRIGEDIKEKLLRVQIIPHAVDYFTGEASWYDDEDDFEDYYEGTDSDWPDEDADEDDAPASRLRGGGGRGGHGGLPTNLSDGDSIAALHDYSFANFELLVLHATPGPPAPPAFGVWSLRRAPGHVPGGNHLGGAEDYTHLAVIWRIDWMERRVDDDIGPDMGKTALRKGSADVDFANRGWRGIGGYK